MENQIKIDQFLNDEGKITKLPKKQKVRYAVLEYLALKFEYGRVYSEKEVNAVCDKWHTFDDFFILRRELVDNKLLNRRQDGSEYWKMKGEVE